VIIKPLQSLNKDVVANQVWTDQLDLPRLFMKVQQTLSRMVNWKRYKVLTTSVSVPECITLAGW